MPSLMLFTLTNDPEICNFGDLEVSLSIILIIGLFCLNHMMVIFSKSEKKFISQQTLKVPYIYDVHIEVG